jgi:hypothetical protein
LTFLNKHLSALTKQYVIDKIPPTIKERCQRIHKVRKDNILDFMLSNIKTVFIVPPITHKLMIFDTIIKHGDVQWQWNLITMNPNITLEMLHDIIKHFNINKSIVFELSNQSAITFAEANTQLDIRFKNFLSLAKLTDITPSQFGYDFQAHGNFTEQDILDADHRSKWSMDPLIYNLNISLEFLDKHLVGASWDFVSGARYIRYWREIRKVTERQVLREIEENGIFDASRFNIIIGFLSGDFIRKHGVKMSGGKCEYFRAVNIDYVLTDQHVCPNCEKNIVDNRRLWHIPYERYQEIMHYEQLAEHGELTMQIVKKTRKAWNLQRLAGLSSIDLAEFLEWIKDKHYSRDQITDRILDRPEIRDDISAFIRAYYKYDISWNTVIGYMHKN